MAVVTVTSNKASLRGYDYTRSLGELLDLKDAEPLGGSSTSLSFQLTNGAVLRLSGTGFTYGNNDLPTAGTVTGLHLFLGSNTVPLHAVTGLNLALVAVMDQAEANWRNPWLLQEWMLGGSDTIDARASTNGDLYGGRGNDVFRAGNGSFMQGGQGQDTYHGGQGFDTISFEDANWDPTAFKGVVANLATRRATDPWGNSETFSSIEEVRGTQFADRFTGSGAAHEEFMGLGGSDVIDGGGGFDLVRHDHDELRGGLRAVTVDLAAGYAIDSFGRRDTLISIEGATGTSFDDKLYGSSAANKLYGMDGDDILDGRGGADELYGGYGNDTYYIDNSRDKIFETTAKEDLSNDTIYSSIDIDIRNTNKFHGSIEYIRIIGTATSATGSDNEENIFGNDLNNTIKSGGGRDLLHGGAGDDTLYGGDGDDLVNGSSGNDTIMGGAGDDHLIGGEGADTLVGGTGRDWAQYNDFARSVVAHLADPTKNTGNAAGDTYSSIENLLGSRSRDTLVGDNRPNVLDGERGRDILTGGGGADGFRFRWQYDDTYDTITDFAPGVDRIELEHWQFSALAEGTLASSAFIANTSGIATSADQHVIYETDTGMLRYDSDGSGSQAGFIFAAVTPGLALTHEDFLVI